LNRYERCQIRQAIVQACGSGVPCVLFVLVSKEGSFFRNVGFCNVLRADGSFVLFNAGPCLDAQLREAGKTSLATGATQLKHWDTSSSQDELFGSSLGCGGKLTWLILRLDGNGQEHLDALVGRDRQIHSEVVEWSLNVVEVDQTNAARLIPKLSLDAVSKAKDLETTQRILRHADPSVMIYGHGADALCVADALIRSGWVVSVFDRKSFDAAQIDADIRTAVCSAQSFAAHVNLNEPNAVLLMSHDVWTDRQILCDLRRDLATAVAMIGTNKRADLVYGALPEEIAEFWRSKLTCPIGARSSNDSPFTVALQIAAALDAQMVRTAVSIAPHTSWPISLVTIAPEVCEVIQ